MPMAQQSFQFCPVIVKPTTSVYITYSGCSLFKMVVIIVKKYCGNEKGWVVMHANPIALVLTNFHMCLIQAALTSVAPVDMAAMRDTCWSGSRSVQCVRQAVGASALKPAGGHDERLGSFQASVKNI